MEEKDQISGLEAFAKIQVIEVGGWKKVFVGGHPYMSWKTGDQDGQRVAIVELYNSEIANQEELAKAFGVHIRSIYNYISMYEEEGFQGLIEERSGPKGNWKITPEVKGKILWMVIKDNVNGYKEIQDRLEKGWKLKISLASIRQVLIDSGLIKEQIQRDPLWIDGDLFEENQLEIGLTPKEGVLNRGEEINREINWDEDNRLEENTRLGDDSGENKNKGRRYRRDYAQAERRYMDELERGLFSSYAGGFLFMPLIEKYNFTNQMRGIIPIETHEGYSLRQLCLTLFYFDLFDFRSIEDFKMAYAEEYGVLIGKLSSPSLQTLRRFLHRVRELKKGEELIESFARSYLKSGLVQRGAFYIDGHFLPYYGARTITMGLHGVQDKILKGSHQFLMVDEKFNPLLFLLRPSSDDLLEMIPVMIEQARRLGREAGIDVSELTLIFDREGYSAELFRKLNEMNPKVKFITWAKYMDRWVGDYKEDLFDKSVEINYEIQKKEEIKYFEIRRSMNKYGEIRTLVIESGQKRQRAAIYTNDQDSAGARIIQLICRRWGHETLNKTFKWDHKMDYHPGYVQEELDEQPLVDNPKFEELKKQKTTLVSKLNGLRIQFAQKVFEKGREDINLKEIKEKNPELCMDMDSLHAQITLLDLEINKFPKEVHFNEAHDGKKLVQLDYEKKRFLDCMKVFTYMMEKKMCSILSQYYDDPKDIYSILAMIVRRGGDIKLETGKLRVRLKGFRNPVVDYAARHVCEDLNQMQPYTLDKFHFPLHFEVSQR